MASNIRPSSNGHPPFDVSRVRADFPILHTRSHGKHLVYLDNGATTQKPRAVIDRLVRYYETENANIHRGVYELSHRATDVYEEARRIVARFINAFDDKEVIFTRGTTEAINLVASSFGRRFIRAGDEIIVSALEHHSDIVPWQMVAETVGARIRVIPINDAGELLLDEYANMLNDRTRLVAVNHVSNALGTINDIKCITHLAHAAGAKVLVDGAQWVAHHPTDVRALGCDFYCFSGHKLYGPTGIGVLWGRRELLEQMPPYQGGGDMIESVSFAKTIYAGLPNKFEAGTPDISGAAGLGAAIEYVESIGFNAIAPYEDALLKHATEKLSEIPGLRIIGTAAHKAGVISFVIDDPPISSLDIGTRLDADGIAVRTGHHCCQPIMDRLGIGSTARASFAMYNTIEEINALANALRRIVVEETARRKKSEPVSAMSASEDRASAPAAEVLFAAAAAASPQAAADDLAGDFELFEDREAKSEYVIDLGNKLPHTFEMLKGITTRVPGCMSEVYVVTRRVSGSADAIEFVADANADIVRGLIAILQRVYSGQRVEEVLAFDIEGFFRRIGLDQFITNQRRTGLAGMIQRIRQSAANLAGQPAATA
ncbi:MAG: cysteine desulfurase, SufS subfamily [Phycisphaerales bacterium]|nr:cysteine desulfurase, SufS subfamily [Phycisphaerales bacterium]